MRQIVIRGDGTAVYRETVVSDETAEDLAESIKQFSHRIDQAERRHIDPLVAQRDALILRAVKLDEAQPGVKQETDDGESRKAID